MCELLGASCFGRDLPVIPKWSSCTGKVKLLKS